MGDLVDENGEPQRQYINKYRFVKDRIKYLKEHIDCLQRVVSKNICVIYARDLFSLVLFLNKLLRKVL